MLMSTTQFRVCFVLVKFKLSLEDVSDSKTFVTADYMGGSRAASPDLEEMLEHGLAAIDDRQESEEPHEKEEYVAVNQEQLEKLEKECNFRHEILRPKIAELSTAEPVRLLCFIVLCLLTG